MCNQQGYFGLGAERSRRDHDAADKATTRLSVERGRRGNDGPGVECGRQGHDVAESRLIAASIMPTQVDSSQGLPILASLIFLQLLMS